MQDAFATESLMRAKKATEAGAFAHEIAPVSADGAEVTIDELPARADPAKIPLLKPAFREGGTITAANSSAISDWRCRARSDEETEAKRRDNTVFARIIGTLDACAGRRTCSPPSPIGAIAKLLERIGWTSDSVDLYEINEAFAVVTLAAMRDLHLAHEKVNVNGGACALGHPIGASGARVVVTLIHALQERGLKRGIASLCIGGGEATAMAIELV